MKEEMILEAIAASGQAVIDAVETKHTWVPEANRYSRAFDMSVLMPLISSHLKPAEVGLLMSLISQMNSENKIGSKILKQIDMSRTTLWRSIQTLEEKGCIYEFPDGSYMVNPRIVVLSKYRKNCLNLQWIWQTEMKKIMQPEGEKCFTTTT